MSVERLAKYRTDDPFTRIPNTAINDPAVDLKALGLLVLMLSKPDGWRFVERNLASDAGVGRSQLRTAIATLIEAGYVVRETEVEDGRPVTVTKVSDVPRWNDEGHETEPSRGSRNPTVGKPDGPETRPPSNNSTGSNERDSSNEGSTSVVPTSVVEVPRHQRDPVEVWSREVVELTREFAAMVQANGHGLPKRNTKAADGWFDAFDKLLRIGPPGDGVEAVTVDEVRTVMRWALQVSDFWPANIRSGGKFREQFTRLRAASRTPARRQDGIAMAEGYEAAAAALRAKRG